jgi:hypothetical protein
VHRQSSIIFTGQNPDCRRWLIDRAARNCDNVRKKHKEHTIESTKIGICFFCTAACLDNTPGLQEEATAIIWRDCAPTHHKRGANRGTEGHANRNLGRGPGTA